MLYSSTNMATVSVKRLTRLSVWDL